MWPFRKKDEEELKELKIPFSEPERRIPEGIASETYTGDKHELILSKLDTIIAKLESIEQRLRNLER